MFLQEEKFLHGVFWPAMDLSVMKHKGNCFGHVWILFGAVISWRKRLHVWE
jgi:hypothetical protein